MPTHALSRCILLGLLVALSPSPASAQRSPLMVSTDRDRLAGIIRDGAPAATVEREWKAALDAAGGTLTREGIQASAADVMWRGTISPMAAPAKAATNDAQALLETLDRIGSRIEACNEIGKALAALVSKKPTPPPERADPETMADYNQKMHQWTLDVARLLASFDKCERALDGQLQQFDLQSAQERVSRSMEMLSALSAQAHQTSMAIIKNLK